MQLKTAFVSAINRGILRLICIIHHAIFSILYICVDFHVEIRAEPFCQLLFTVGAPEDTPVQNSAVLKAVGKTADIYGTSFSGFIYRHLYFFFPLHQNLRILIRKYILLTFAKVYGFCSVRKDKMFRMLFPVIFIIIERKTSLFLHAEHICHL